MPDFFPSFKTPANTTQPYTGPLRSQYDMDVKEQQSNDPLWKKWGRNAVDIAANIPKGLLGVDPAADESGPGFATNAMMQMGSAAEAPAKALAGKAGVLKAVSMFSKPIYREAATERFLQDAATMPTNIAAALKDFGERYPRVAAHSRPMLGESVANPTANAMAVLPRGQIQERVPMVFTKRGVRAAEMNPSNANNFVRHEGTHVAQGLGNRDTVDLYEAADDLGGYRNIPHEVNARAGAGENPRVNINQKLIEMSQKALDHPNPLGYQTKAANKIQDVLKRRGIIQDQYRGSGQELHNFLNDYLVKNK